MTTVNATIAKTIARERIVINLPSQSDSNPSQPTNWARTDLVTIYVGKEKQRYTYHEGVLCAASPYFATSLKTSWNGGCCEITLSDVDASIFELAMDLIYKQSQIVDVDLKTTPLTEVAALYKFLDYLMIEKMKNDLVDHLIDHVNSPHGSQYIRLTELGKIHEAELCSTKFYTVCRKYSVVHFMKSEPARAKSMLNELESNSDSLDSHFFMLFLDAILRFNMSPTTIGTVTWKCKYHDHVETTRCSLVTTDPNYVGTTDFGISGTVTGTSLNPFAFSSGVQHFRATASSSLFKGPTASQG